MQIIQSDEIVITLSPLEYKRLYEILTDYSCEYCSSGDIIFDMLKSMENINEQK